MGTCRKFDIRLVALPPITAGRPQQAMQIDRILFEVWLIRTSVVWLNWPIRNHMSD